MHDVTWRTGCTFAILALLVLLGSGRLLGASDPAAGPLATGEGTRGPSYEAPPSPAESGDNRPVEDRATLPARTTARQHRAAPFLLHVVR